MIQSGYEHIDIDTYLEHYITLSQEMEEKGKQAVKPMDYRFRTTTNIYPTSTEWETINKKWEYLLNRRIKSIEQKINLKIVPAIPLLKVELAEFEESSTLYYFECYRSTNLAIPQKKDESRKLEAYSFGCFTRDIATLKYGRYLKQKITDLERDGEDNTKVLEWCGKPSQLGYIISELVQKGYIDAPTNKNGEVNYKALAKLVKNSFNISSSEDSLAKSLNPNSESGQINDAAKQKFKIPLIDTIN